MRRFVTLAILFLFAIPFGISVSGCKHALAPTYCNGQDSGVQTGQLTTLDLEPRLTGISLNQGEIGRVNSPNGKDCRGNSASTGNLIYASTNIYLADVAPTTGSLCAGSWNRNTGSGIADFTVCTPSLTSGVAYVTTSSGDVTSNPIPIFIHAVVTSIVLGPASTNCTLDPASNCVDLNQISGCDSGVVSTPTAYAGNTCISQGNTAQLVARTYGTVTPQFTITGFSLTANVATFQTTTQNLTSGQSVTLSGFPAAAAPTPTNPNPGPSTSAFLNGLTVHVQSATSTSFTASITNPNVPFTVVTGQGTGTPVPNTNISCVVGPLQFGATNSAVVTIDANGVATASAPGSSTITADIAQASSTAGFFSTCPPKSIVFTTQGQTTPPTGAISINQNTSQPLIATVLDTNNVVLNNLTLEYVSTSPTTIPANSATITPTYPGAAVITAICQPPGCNPAPFDEIGLFGNGLPITSNPVQITSTGTDYSTVLYIASKDSQYLLPVDFTVPTQATPVRLPYPPNSFVLSQDLSAIYMGTNYGEIMIFSPGTNALTKQDTSVSGTVLAVSPDSTTVIITDPNRQLIYLYNSSGGVNTEYGGVANSAQFSPDSQTVYITTTDGRLLVHSSFTGWSAIPLTTTATGVAVTVPSLGAYLASAPVDVRTNCPATTIVNPGQGFAQSTTNVFYPDLGAVGANATSLAATTNGLHILSAYSPSALPSPTTGASTFTDIFTNAKSGNCPVTFTSTPGTPITLTPLGTTSTIGSVLTTSDSNFGFLTYSVPSTQTTQGVVPQYVPGATAGVGTLSYLKFQQFLNGGVPTAPVAGAVSANNGSLFVGTSGDDLVHIFTLQPGSTPSFGETTTPINPQLPSFSHPGTIAVPNLLAQKPRRATS